MATLVTPVTSDTGDTLIQKELTQEVIEEWVRNTTGVFSLKDLYSEKHLDTEELKTYARVCMSRLAKKNIVISINSRDGFYRLVDVEAPVIDWKEAGTNYFPIKWPFKLEEYVLMPRRGVALVGGSWNAGKSALGHNVYALNYKDSDVWLWDSEHSKEEIRNRLSNFPDWQYWPSDHIRERTKNFEDVIVPDALNIIDYLEITEEFYLVGAKLRLIRDKLTTGIAVVLLQKPKGRELPLGKDLSMALPRLVLTMDSGILTILKAKNWTVRNVNPNNKRWRFSLVGGEKFVNIREEGGFLDE